jgi:hypothetical protein
MTDTSRDAVETLALALRICGDAESAATLIALLAEKEEALARTANASQAAVREIKARDVAQVHARYIEACGRSQSQKGD